MANRKNEAKLQNLIRRIVREELKRAKEAEKPLGFSDFDEQLIPQEKNFQSSSPRTLFKRRGATFLGLFWSATA